MRTTLVITLVLLLTQVSFAQQDTLNDPLYLLRRANKAYDAKEYKEFLSYLQKALQIAPDHPPLHYNLACGYALIGDKDNAMRWLRQVVKEGAFFHAFEDQDLDTLRSLEEFKSILKEFEQIRVPRGEAAVAFTVPEKGLTAENVSYDPVTERFFLGSIHKRKIVQRDKAGQISDFASEKQDGLFTVLGMKVDARRRILWAASPAERTTGDLKPGELGKSAVFKYDLAKNRILRRYDLDNRDREHLLNDLVLNTAGDVFVTDYLTGMLCRVPHDADTLEPFVMTAPTANGIAISDDGRFLFVGTENRGIYRCDIASRAVVKIMYPETISAYDIDGLYFYKNSLLAVQTAFNRVAQFFLDPALSTIDSMRIVISYHPSFEMPTTGVLVGDELYLVANCQYNKFTREGKLSPLDKYNDTIILRVKLQ